MRHVSCNKPVIFSSVNKSLHTNDISISKTVPCSISCKPVSALISSEPVKSFVTSKPFCFSDVRIAKDFKSLSYSSVTCTEHPINNISSTVRKSVVSHRTACPANFDIVVQTVRVTLLCTYHCPPSKYVIALLTFSFPFWSFHCI